jgi:hypothetical protein
MTFEEQFQEKLRQLAQTYELRLVEWRMEHSLHHPLQPLSLTIKISGIPRDPDQSEMSSGDTLREGGSIKSLGTPWTRMAT